MKLLGRNRLSNDQISYIVETYDLDGIWVQLNFDEKKNNKYGYVYKKNLTLAQQQFTDIKEWHQIEDKNED